MKVKKSDTNDKKAFSDIIELYKLEEQYKQIKKNYEDKKKSLSVMIRNYMYSKDYSQLDFKSKEYGNVHVTNVIRKSIIWDVEKLKKKLDNDLVKQIVEKKYIVTDMKGLVQYLKSCGVNPKKFKSYIYVEEKVNQQKMNELSEIGEIDAEDIKGCYELKEAEGYLRINVKEHEDGECKQ